MGDDGLDVDSIIERLLEGMIGSIVRAVSIRFTVIGDPDSSPTSLVLILSRSCA